MEKTKQSSRKARSIRNWAIFAIVSALAGVGAYFVWPASETTAAEPALQTARARVGDLVITASGAGTVVPAAQVDLGFRSGGVVDELGGSVGDAVKAGQILARLEGNVQAEADFQALFTANGILQAQGVVAETQNSLDKAVENLKYLISPLAYYYEEKLAEAQAELEVLRAESTATKEAIAEAEADLKRAENSLKYAQNLYVEEYVPATFTYSWKDTQTMETMTETIPPSDGDVILARANVEAARVALQDAQAALEIVQAGPDALTRPLAALGSQVAKIERTRLAMESTRLVAPFDGTITSLTASVGQTVGSAPVLSVATTENLLARFYLDETDADKVAAGRRATFVFDAYPELSLAGEILRVEPALQIVDGAPALVVWAKLTDTADVAILAGMSVEVEVTSGEARGALIVPVQALRELTPGSYAVFVVQDDGSLQMTPVTVGLRDYANAEILEGLEVGDVVSTGTVETRQP
ncbi:MAG: efflux RND transporter periplasmic adaptor subunit [Anaerolineales bacterium]|nr:efflux RND transporter periplasmic adaptor subunit [Anaerolineales bacterium]